MAYGLIVFAAGAWLLSAALGAPPLLASKIAGSTVLCWVGFWMRFNEGRRG